MGISTLITTNTSSGAATSDFTSGISSSYDEYMFVFTDLNPVTSGGIAFQVNAVGGSGYGGVDQPDALGPHRQLVPGASYAYRSFQHLDLFYARPDLAQPDPVFGNADALGSESYPN